MNTTTITIKTDSKVKAKAQRIAEKMGMSLTTMINRYLKSLIRTKSKPRNAKDEIPNKYLQGLMKKAEEDYKKGNTSPAFKTGEEAVAWLEKQGI